MPLPLNHVRLWPLLVTDPGGDRCGSSLGPARTLHGPIPNASLPSACWLLHPLSLGLRANASPAALEALGKRHQVGECPGGPAELGAPSLKARLWGRRCSRSRFRPRAPPWMRPRSQLTLAAGHPPREAVGGAPTPPPFPVKGSAPVTVPRQAGGPLPTQPLLPVDAILGEGAKRPRTPWRSGTQALKWSGHYGR